MNWKKRFVSQKLNVKFTLVIILFMVIPIGILAGILFYNMEKNVVSENTGYMEYTMERNKDAVATKINSINMSTQFFLSDEPLLEMLKRTKDGETFSAEEWYSFKNSDCEFPYKSRVMGTSEPLKPLKAPYMARNPVKWGFFRLKGQEIPLKI